MLDLATPKRAGLMSAGDRALLQTALQAGNNLSEIDPVAARNSLLVAKRDPLSLTDVLPALDLKFTSAGVVTTQFTRASAATRTRSSGLLESVGSNILRIDADPVTGANCGALIEEQRTNSLLYSEQLDNAAWTRYGTITVTANSVTAPNGSQTADTLVMSSASGLYQGFSASPGIIFSGSVWLRSDAPTTVSLQAKDNTGGAPVSVVCNVTTSWQRFSASKLTASGTTFALLQISGPGTVYAWGAQAEVGNFPTSYIPTTSAAATRATDSLIVPTSSFEFNQNEGTLFVKAKRLMSGKTGVIADINDGGFGNRIFLIQDASANLLAYVAHNSTYTLFGVGIVVPGTDIRATLSYKAGTFSACMNGGAVSSGTYGNDLGPLTNMRIGSEPGGAANLWNDPIERVSYLPRAIDNTTHQRMTA